MMNNYDFNYACKEYLLSLSLDKLRAYGRSIGVDRPTEQKKGQLILSIMAILSGSAEPVPMSKRGAPVKNDHVDPSIPKEIERIRSMNSAQAAAERAANSYDYKARLDGIRKNPVRLIFKDPSMEEPEFQGERKIYKGQLETLNGVAMLLPLDCFNREQKLIMPVELIRQFELEEGDVVTCYAEQQAQHLVAINVLTVNDYVCDTYKRGKFDESAVCFPNERLHFYDGNKFNGVTQKYLEWLIPFGKGERGLIVAPPKSGKSTLFLQTAGAAKELNEGVYVFVLLVGQSPENISLFRKQAPSEHMVYTTYEDEPERQVFVAEFLLRRAKCFAECGRDVLLLVDSINALASAYNDTEASSGGKLLPGGLESKTVQYLKRYLGAARCFEKGGSLTILGALSTNTGNPADEVLFNQLSPISGLELALSEDLAKRRVYPALDFAKTKSKSSAILSSEAEARVENMARDNFGAEALTKLLQNTSTFTQLEKSVEEN